MTNPLDKLATALAGHLGKEPSDPEVLRAAVDVVMAIRVPSEAMEDAVEYDWEGHVNGNPSMIWQAMIDALLTEGEG